MENVDEKNGCLYVIPGSHKGVLLKHGYPEVGRIFCLYILISHENI